MQQIYAVEELTFSADSEESKKGQCVKNSGF